MITVIARFQVKPEYYADFLVASERLIAETRMEQGCISYELHQENNHSDCLIFLEHWQSQEQLDAHSASAHFRDIVPQLMKMSNDVVVETYSKIR